MNKYMELALNSWEETRSETIAFIRSLSREMLIMQMPRPGLNSFGYHVQELGVVQIAFTNALRNGSMDYSLMAFQLNNELISKADNLIEFLNEQNASFRNAVADVLDPHYIIDWQLPRNPTALEHVFWLMQHETLHQGQFLAFCYIMNIPIPEVLSQHWNMPPIDPQIVEKWIASRGQPQ